MHDRASLTAIVRGITPLDSVEADHRSDTIEWIASGEALYRVAKPAVPPKHLVAYFVLVDLARDAVLLVDHRNAGMWLPTGGHVEPGEDPLATVDRELGEELGVEAKLIDGLSSNPLLVTQTTTVGRDHGHVDVTLWYALQGTVGMPLSPDFDEFVAVRWWTFDAITAAAPDEIDPHLTRFVAKLTARALERRPT